MNTRLRARDTVTPESVCVDCPSLTSARFLSAHHSSYFRSERFLNKATRHASSRGVFFFEDSSFNLTPQFKPGGSSKDSAGSFQSVLSRALMAQQAGARTVNVMRFNGF